MWENQIYNEGNNERDRERKGLIAEDMKQVGTKENIKTGTDMEDSCWRLEAWGTHTHTHDDHHKTTPALNSHHSTPVFLMN
jgi:hypothetical protein